MPTRSAREPRVPKGSSTQVVLREAKRLHRAATSDSAAAALPVLRRLLAAGVAPTQALPSLYRVRGAVQRKHILRTLALEAGHETWEEFCRALPLLDVQQLEQATLAQRGASTLKLWFANEADAKRFAAQHGGQAMRVGRQAVVLPGVQVGASEAGG